VRNAIRYAGPFVLVSFASLAVGCGAAEGSPRDDESSALVGEVESALVASDSVSRAVTASCSTTVVKGLASQLVDEIQCLRPNTFARIDGIPNTSLGSAVFPYLQMPAAAALKSVAARRSSTVSVTSGLRTLPQQFLLYRWYQTGRCGIGLAARPGTSNHESGLALDISDSSVHRSALQSGGFRWLGSSDPVHYDYTAGGVSLKGLSVKAFQRLWNRNNPGDKIAEDGDYGPATEARLAKAPIGGFSVGATCGTNPLAGDSDPVEVLPDEPNVLSTEPDANEVEVGPSDVGEASSDETASVGKVPASLTAPASSCAAAPLPTPKSDEGSRSGVALCALGMFGVALLRRRPRRPSGPGA
jgi:hypothetical protein